MLNKNFKPKQITKKIISHLPNRTIDVIINSYGLDNKDLEKKTLEEIGKKYNITRERVRQIKENGITMIKKSSQYKMQEEFFIELRNFIKSLGGIIGEHDLLNHISKDKSVQNHIHFHLVLGDHFKKHKEDEHFKARWSVDENLTNKVHESLKSLYATLNDDDLFSETEMIKNFFDHMKDVAEEYRDDEIAKRWLSISKKIGKNPFSDWGKTSSQNVNTKGVKDYAFLVMRRHGSPMHFKEVAEAISKTFNKKVNYATTHNELIKDSRFVLVGRGLYALSEWGYKTGIARDVIMDILKKEGPMKKEDIVEKVMKERYFKKNTILVNLANSKYFKKTSNGSYTIV